MTHLLLNINVYYSFDLFMSCALFSVFDPDYYPDSSDLDPVNVQEGKKLKIKIKGRGGGGKI